MNLEVKQMCKTLVLGMNKQEELILGSIYRAMEMFLKAGVTLYTSEDQESYGYV